MYTKKKYSKWTMLRWTRNETRFFIIFTAIVTVLYEVVGLQWLQLPWTPIALIGTAVAFLIGFQNNAAYGRIWEARIIWGGIVNNSRTWAMMARDMVTNEHAKVPKTEEALQAERTKLVYKNIAWLTALRYAMRQNKPWETVANRGTNKEWFDAFKLPELNVPIKEELSKVLPEEDVAYIMSKKNKQNAVLTLMSKQLRELKEAGYIWEFSFLEMENVLKEFFSLQGKSERIKNFPYPRQYATLSYDFVNMFILLLPFGIVPEFHKIGINLSESFPLIGEYFVWLSIPFGVIVSWIFNTMQRIGTVGENPFEGSPNDVPITTMARGIEIDIREMIDELEEIIPEPYPVIRDVQM
ncbi:bestrophin family protein [Roseivirga pacifica]|uniref:bestrophin family protein n=1 Tax=Roseivirga pacifica TaxID=1267423 RepID=UPI002095148E|nr:bestrophin family ion channel [Roseivirga pacifica]